MSSRSTQANRLGRELSDVVTIASWIKRAHATGTPTPRRRTKTAGETTTEGDN